MSSYFTAEQAVEIWKAKWLGQGPQVLVEKYKRSPFRFYEVWTEEKNAGTREIALEQFSREFPQLANTIDSSPHTPKRKVISAKKGPSDQGELF